MAVCLVDGLHLPMRATRMAVWAEQAVFQPQKAPPVFLTVMKTVKDGKAPPVSMKMMTTTGDGMKITVTFPVPSGTHPALCIMFFTMMTTAVLQTGMIHGALQAGMTLGAPPAGTVEAPRGIAGLLQVGTLKAG
ncbi:MAG: hypothetical protein D6804_07975 [Aquificota bacterium]|nr:MAG: hypothetical protein D6804_07975 [Aquificota bacterium]